MSQKNQKIKPRWSILLAGAVLLQTIAGAGYAAYNGKSFIGTASAAESSALPAATKDGVIFHAWNWSFDNIKANLPAIAAAGFKSIQTSPIQGNKEAATAGSNWWVLYQPTNFTIGNTQLGTREQFRQMNAEADKYGISIIVDVVANHTGNAGGGNLTYTPATNVDPTILNNQFFWHEKRGIENWDDRWQVTQWGIGLPDLNTSNQELQDKIIAFLNDAVALGADGFRFDAAKHIELPEDPAGSNFWTRVLGSLNNKDKLYNYGEILQGGADNIAGYANHMNVTASKYGEEVRLAVGFGGNVNVGLAQPFLAGNVNPSKLVTWVESHDTYANDSSESTAMTDYQLKMGWALIAARAQTTSLFFDRPAGTGKFGSNLGATGKGLWKDGDIIAVNKFHNAMAAEGEYLRTQGNQTMLIERGTKGMVIVNLGGNMQINSVTNMANGTYTNKASGGGSFTVANGRITGSLGAGKIAVLYNDPNTIATPTPPAQNLVNVTFTIQNATTVMGQNVYISGSIPELGSWDVSKAIGPGSSASYPTWTVTAQLPAGTVVQYKALKKDASGNVVWESGENRSYTVSASNPNATFAFRP
ncbi:alpha-amylase [Paenibacillaceae bacterium GAS479]|nr:alpha-amylase [Paenibacillaceae bacterium GAS479]